MFRIIRLFLNGASDCNMSHLQLELANMTRVVEAIYSNGHLEPLEDLALAEQERVTLIVQRHDRPEPAQQDAALRVLLHGMKKSTFRSGGKLPSRDELHERP